MLTYIPMCLIIEYTGGEIKMTDKEKDAIAEEQVELRMRSMMLTPNYVQFETSAPLTEKQIAKLNFFVDELLFDDEDEDDIPEFTTDVSQHRLQ
jgi:hypothetical protein